MIIVLSSMFMITLISWDNIFFIMLMSFIVLMMSFNGSLFLMLDLSYNENILIYLSLIIVYLMIMSSIKYVNTNIFLKDFMINIVTLLLILMICFSANSLFVFYIMFELSIIPTYFLIMGWGYSNERIQAAIYMFVYTLISSLPFLMFLFKMNMGTMSQMFHYLLIINLLEMKITWYFMFFLVFMVKLPIFLLHIWLPKAHVEAPVSGSMILAGVLLKLGGYGIFKSLFILNKFMILYKIFLMTIMMWGSLMISLICMRQMDLKCLIAYSSVAHMGPMSASIISMISMGWVGALIFMVAHGLASSGLFYGMNLIYEDLKTRSIILMKNQFILNSIFTFWWFFLCCMNMSCPPSMNFFSELLIIMGLMTFYQKYLMMMMMFLMMSGIYSIYMFISITHGKLFTKMNQSFLNNNNNLMMLIHCIPLILFYLMFKMLFFY